MRRSLKLIGLPISLALISQHSKVKQQCNDIKLYLWGNGEYQARPDASMQFGNFRPKLIKNFGKDQLNIQLKDIGFGYKYNGGIDQQGRLLIFIKEIIDSAESQESDNNISEHIILDDKENYKQIGFTDGFIWGLSEEGRVFQWKIEKNSQEKYNRQIKTGEKRMLESLKEYNIKEMGLGEDHVVFLSDKQKVISLGDDTYGQCGIGPKVQNLNRMTMPPFIGNRVSFPYHISELDDKQIIKVVCGQHHSIAISQAGQVYVWGNNSHLQLSHRKEYAKQESPLMAIFKPTPLNFFQLSDNKVVNAAAGDKFTIFVTIQNQTNETEVFGSGENMRGQLGSGGTRHVQDLTLIESLSNFQIKDKNNIQQQVRIDEIKCGNNHCIAKLNVGVLMQWGDNEYGQQGNGKRTYLETPKIINQFKNENVTHVFAGQNQTAVFIQNNDK